MPLNNKNFLTKIPKILGFFVFLLSSVFVSFITSSSLPASTTYAAACSSNQTSNTSYSLVSGSGNVVETTTGYYTHNSGRTTECLKYGDSGNETGVIVFSKTSDTKYEAKNITCGAVITFGSAPTGAGRKNASIQNRNTARGGCTNNGDAKSISVTVTGSGSDVCKESYILYKDDNSLYAEVCNNGVVSTRSFTKDSGNERVYNFSIGSDRSCQEAAKITLNSDPTGSTVGAKYQAFGSNGRTCTTANGAARDITLKVESVDCSSLGDYAAVGCSYSQVECEKSGAMNGGAASFKMCRDSQVIVFKSFVDECSKDNASKEDTIKCLAEKAGSVKAELEAMLEDAIGKVTCAIDGVGWIICPAISFMATIADSAFSFLSDSFLAVDSDIVATGSTTHQVWGVMRNLANVAFVIAFLFIIFSQMTGQGIANYGIKKLLPRLVISAILVNVSFFICQIAVDVSNILGYSLHQFFQSVGGGVTLPNGSVPTNEGGNWAGITLTVLAGGVIAWSLGVSVLLPFLLGAVIALLMVFIILVVRQMLIILLVVVAPIAFVAFLLPNTEQWFTKWRKMFVSLLLVFPLIGLLFGAAGLASTILRAVTYSAGDETGIIGQIVAAGIVALPLFLLPSLLKSSLNSAGSIGSKLNGLSDKFSKGARSKSSNSGLMKNYAARKAEKRTAISTGTYKGISPVGRLRSRVNKSLNNSGAFNAITRGYGAERTLVGQAQQRKDAQEAMSMFAGNDSLVEAWASSGGDFSAVPSEIMDGMTPDQQDQLKTQFTLMRNAGLHKKPTSYLAAAQYLSENGKGSATAVNEALKNAGKSGASSVEVGSAGAAAIAAYRKSGRGDAMADLSTLTGAKAMSQTEGWAQVSASSVHRDALGTKKDPLTGARVKTDGQKSYEAHLLADAENTRQALAGYDSMEQRAKEKAQTAIIDAANTHAGTGVTITNIKDAKAHFGIK